jgi:hypothetical protein
MGFLTELIQNAIKALSRFPITLSWAVLGSFFLIVNSGNDHISLVLILGVSWLIAVQFISEALNHTTIYRFLLKIFILGGLAGFYFYLEQPEINNSNIAIGQWLLLLLAGHVFVIFAPFFNTWHKSRFWNFLKEIAISLLRSAIYSFILFLGLALAVAALDFLFDIKLNSDIYLQIFIFCLGIINTFIFLRDFPKADELEITIHFNKAIAVLLKYILIPLSLLYIIIVYVYAVKILLSWELPRGWVTYLISALSFLAFVIHIAIEPVRIKHPSKLIQKFFPLYFYAILPLLPLLFIALFKRISDYNFTELRYLGLVLALWISGMLLYMLISKKKRLSLYAKFMFLLILICTFGPLSAFKISLSAQLQELGELLDDLDTKKELSFKPQEYERFESVIKYINNRKALEKTEPYFGFNPEIAFSETGSYRMPRKIVDSLGIRVENVKERNLNRVKNYVQYTFKPNFAEEITTYTHFTELDLDEGFKKEQALQLCFNDENIISFRHYGEPLLETNMTSHLKTLGDKYDYLSQASQDEFTFRYKNENGDFLLIFNQLQFYYQNREVQIRSGKAKVFYKTYSALELP